MGEGVSERLLLHFAVTNGYRIFVYVRVSQYVPLSLAFPSLYISLCVCMCLCVLVVLYVFALVHLCVALFFHHVFRCVSF